MEYLKELLTSNPIIVLIMFLITFISGIIAIVLGWKKFYEDYLSKKIYLPVWALFLLFILACVFIITITGKKPIEEEMKEFVIIEGKQFGVQQVVLDGKRFVRCFFDGTELIVKGEQDFQMERNSLTNCKFTVYGHAARTLKVLTAMYKDISFRPIVDKTIQNIKEGKIVNSTPISDTK
jgi:hypothetical protein